jgi:hypothetical protein
VTEDLSFVPSGPVPSPRRLAAEVVLDPEGDFKNFICSVSSQSDRARITGVIIVAPGEIFDQFADRLLFQVSPEVGATRMGFTQRW